MIRMFGAAFAGMALLLSGCGSDSAPAPQSSSSSPAAASAEDEEAIRDVIAEGGAASTAWDGAKMAELTCAKYRDRAGSFDDVVPPMDIFSSAAEAASAMGPEEFAGLIGEQFEGASPDALRAVADAVIADDQAAYHPAMLQVIKQSMKFSLEKVDNIKVNGDTATADTTISYTIGSQPAKSETTEITLVREDGQWKDCTPPTS
jgi:hypothetical protein